MPKPSSPDGLTMSIGDASIPMTMQAQVAHMSLDEAIASGLFDLPDEPGMVRIPVTIHLALTPELQEAIARSAAPDHDPPDQTTPPAAPRRRRGSQGVPDLSGFVADQHFSRHAKPWHESENWLDALAHHATAAPGPQAAGAADVAPILHGMRQADHTPPPTGAIRIVGGPEEDERLDTEGRPLTFREENNQELYFNAYRELRKLDPGNPELETLSPPGWVPDDAAVARMQEAVREAEARNTGACEGTAVSTRAGGCAEFQSRRQRWRPGHLGAQSQISDSPARCREISAAGDRRTRGNGVSRPGDPTGRNQGDNKIL